MYEKSLYLPLPSKHDRTKQNKTSNCTNFLRIQLLWDFLRLCNLTNKPPKSYYLKFPNSLSSYGLNSQGKDEQHIDPMFCYVRSFRQFIKF